MKQAPSIFIKIENVYRNEQIFGQRSNGNGNSGKNGNNIPNIPTTTASSTK